MKSILYHISAMTITNCGDYNRQFRAEAVKFYLSSGKSLRETASRFKVHYLTLHQWVKWFKEGGKINLVRNKPYRKPWNRLKKTLELELMHLKEENPGITVR
ncbi:unnamed protein product, partial [marine sediment metagenome]